MAVRVSAWAYLLQQMAGGACLLLSIGLGTGQMRLRPWRLTLTALLLSLLAMAGAGQGLLLRLPAMGLSALAPLAAWPEAPRRFRGRMAAMGCVLPLVLTGAMRLLSPLPGWAMLAGGCLLVVLLARREGRAAPLPRCALVEVALGRRCAVLNALVDTGNLLRDGVTGLPVIVISRRAAARLTDRGAHLPGMRLLPVRTVAGLTTMPVLRPGRLRIRVGGAWEAAEALIGLSPGGEGFQALVPASLLHPAPDVPLPHPSSQPSTGG